MYWALSLLTTELIITHYTLIDRIFIPYEISSCNWFRQNSRVMSFHSSIFIFLLNNSLLNYFVERKYSFFLFFYHGNVFNFSLLLNFFYLKYDDVQIVEFFSSFRSFKNNSLWYYKMSSFI